MSRNQASLRTVLAVVGAVALTLSRVAAADDSSMSMWTGDSYAYFNDLDYSLGKFNVARSAHADTQFAARKPLFGETVIDVDHAGIGRTARPAADRPARVTLPSPFRDDKGQ